MFGIIWLLNTWFQANKAYKAYIDSLFLKSFDAGITGQPQWLDPYTQSCGQAFTGNRGGILGTAIIYCLIFLYLMIIYPPHVARKARASE